MEQKESKKINLSEFFIIITILIIAILIFSIIKLHNESLILEEAMDNLNFQISDLENQINTLEKNNSNIENTTTSIYQILGSFYQKDASGDEPFYTFSENNAVSFGSLSMCYGTYTITDNTIKINFTSAIDPDGNKIAVTDCISSEFAELTIIDNNTLKDNSNNFIYQNI